VNMLYLTRLFPNPVNRLYGSFVKEFIQFIAHKNRGKLVVISPIPYTFYIKNFKKIPRTLVENGIKIYYIPYLNIPKRKFCYIESWTYLVAISNLMRKVIYDYDIDIIHAHQIFPDGYVALKIGNKFRKPVLITIHGELPELIKANKYKYLSCLKKADAIITIAKFQKTIIEKYHIRSQKIYVIPNGFNPFLFKPFPKKNSSGQKIAVYIGHLYPPKGLPYLIEAVPRIIKKIPNFKLIIVGDGVLRSNLVNLANKLGISEKVTFVGSKNREKIPLWLNIADILVLPSLKEGFPTVLPEAIACGVPVVSTKIYGIPEIISDEVGILVPPANHKALAEAIIRAFKIDWDKNRFKEIAQKYSLEFLAEKMLKIYKDIINEMNLS